MHVTTGTLERGIHTEWDQLTAHELHDFPGIGTFTGEQLLDHMQLLDHEASTASDRDAAYAERDRTHHTLIRLAQEGHRAALAAIMILFRPAVRSTVHRCALHEFGMPLEEAIDSVTSVLWETVMTYPLHRTEHVAGNLRGELIKAVGREFGFLRRKEAPASDYTLEALMSDDAETATGSPAGTSALDDLTTILTWAISHGVVSREEVRLLARIELADEPGQARASAAAELSVSRDTLNRRVHRIRTKLMKAISGDLHSATRICPRRK